MGKSTAVVLLLFLHLLNIGAAATPPLLDSRPQQHLEFELEREAADGPVVGPSAATAKIGVDTTPGTPAPLHPVSSVFDELLSDDVLYGSVKPWTTEDFFGFLTFTNQDDGNISNAVKQSVIHIVEAGDDEEVFPLKSSTGTSTTSTEMTLVKDDDITLSVDDGQDSVGTTSTKNNAAVDQNDVEADSVFADFLNGFDMATSAPNSSVPIDEQKPSLLAIRVQDPEKILDILQLFERYSSLRNTSLLPSIRRKTTEMIRYSPSTLRNVANDHDTNSSYPKVSYSGVGITISDFKTNLPPLKTSSRPTSSSDSSGVLQAFTNFIDDVGEAVGNFLSSVGNAFANNPVLTVLTLGALIFLLFHLLVNYTWLKKKPHHKGHGQGYHRRMDEVETFYDDAVKLQRILDVIDDYERKYGEKIFI